MYSSSHWWRNSVSPADCTPEDLIQILVEPSNGIYVLPIDAYNQVFPHIFLGDGTTALCTSKLRQLGITHVLNAACGKDHSFSLINTSPQFYRSSHIQFLGIEALDLSIFPIYEYFDRCSDWIEEAIKSNGKIYIHCVQGISRSSTLVIAFLMIKLGFTASEAVEQVRKHRNIIPNYGFLQQLCQLNEALIKKRKRIARATALVLDNSNNQSTGDVSVTTTTTTSSSQPSPLQTQVVEVV